MQKIKSIVPLAFRIKFLTSNTGMLDSELIELGINIDQWSAVVADKDPRFRALSTTKVIGKGAVGCWLAHHDLWAHIKNLDPESGPFLVLEEDAKVTNFGSKRLHQVVMRVIRKKMDLVHLGAGFLHHFYRGSAADSGFSGQLRRRIATDLNYFPPVYVPGFRWRTHAYLISSRAATIMSSFTPELTMPVDQWILQKPELRHLRTYYVRQPLFLPTGRPSSIDAIGR